jgi:hypothetical protein
MKGSGDKCMHLRDVISEVIADPWIISCLNRRQINIPCPVTSVPRDYVKYPISPTHVNMHEIVGEIVVADIVVCQAGGLTRDCSKGPIAANKYVGFVNRVSLSVRYRFWREESCCKTHRNLWFSRTLDEEDE